MVKKKKKVSSKLRIEKFRKKIVRVGQIERPLRMGIYSKPGVGKTTFCATARKVLIADCNEEGTLSIADTKVDVTYIKTFEDVNLLYWFLAKGDHDYETVAIDTITSLQGLGLKFVLDQAAELDLTKDPQMANRQDWGKLNNLMIDIINNFRNLPMNLIITAHERSREEEDGDIEVYPLMTPGTRTHFEGVMDIIGRYYIREVVKNDKRKIVRRMLVGPHEKYISKSRAKVLPMILKNPTFPSILKQIRRAKKNG